MKATTSTIPLSTCATSPSNADHQITLSFGTRTQDNMPTKEQISIADLAARFCSPDLSRGTLGLADYLALDKTVPEQKRVRGEEKNGEYFVMGAFGNGGKRHADNLLYLTGFVGDIDTGTVSRADIEAGLFGYEYIVYSSFSHSLQAPMWRFILFYKTEIPATDHYKVYDYMQQAFNGQLDPSCKKPSQIWFTPACPPDAGSIFEFFSGAGELFDPTRLPDTTVAPPPTKAISNQRPPVHGLAHAMRSSEEVHRLMTALGFIDANDRSTWIKVGMAIKNELGDAGQSLWTDWSKSSSKFDEDDADVTWNSLAPQAQGGVTLGTIFHLARQKGYANQPVAASPQLVIAAASALTPLFDIKDASVSHFVQTPAPPRKWLLHNTLPLGKVGMIVAPGGTGKSFLMIQMAVAIATQTLLANHWKVDSPGATLILCAEEDNDDLHHRLRDVLSATVSHSQAMQQLVEQRVFIKSMLTENNLMTHANERREIVQTVYVDRLVLTARHIPDLRLIIIDPASRFRGGDENAAQDSTRFVEALERLRAATGATVLLTHHAGKGSMGADEANQAASRGSSALTDGVRWQMNLNKPTKPQAKEHGVPESARHEYVLATITKNNGAPPQSPVLLLRGLGGVLEVGVGAAPQQGPEWRLINLIQSEASANRTYTANSLESKFSGTTRQLNMSAVALRKLVAACIQLKYLRKRTSKPIAVLELTGIVPP
jgi:hypothetical protein